MNNENTLTSILLNKHVFNKQISINESDFDEIKKVYPKETIINSLAEIISSGYIDLPMNNLALEDAIEAEKNLIDLKTEIKTGQFTTRYEDEKLLSNMYFDESSAYNNASNFFHQDSRFKCDSINSPSPFRVFNDYKFSKSMCGAIFSLKMKKVTQTELYTCLALRKYVASQFKPSIAKAVYDHYKAENVVDLCAGWGDRLSGFFASKYTKKYFGVDANLGLQNNYKLQIKEYQAHIPFCKNKEANVIFGAAEDDNIILPTNTDLVFTSPPYFGIEKYSKDDTQSYIRYKKLNHWLNNFLFKLVDKSYISLNSNGHLVINVSDVYMNHTINEICHPLIVYAQNAGFVLENIYGMKLSKRVNSKSNKAGVFCEPIYSFKKL